MGLDIFFIKKKETEVGYFRKVNFLVAFFESKGMDVENQIDLAINKDMVNDLISRCQKVLDNPELGPSLLPTMDGFFFGNTDYDEYYLEDVKEVKEYCKHKLLPMFDTLKDSEYLCFRIWY